MADDGSAAPATGGSGLTIEAIVAVDSPREFRIHPRDRVVAFTAEAAGARQVFTLSLRGTGTPPTQVTASDKPASDPQWSPDGRRLAFVRDDEIWIVEADGSRLTRVVGKPGGGRDPRWSPDGRRLAFISRRRGWSQVWLIDAPVPRRGRPQRDPRPPVPTPLTRGGFDADGLAWSPDGTQLAVTGQQAPDDLATWQIALVDVDTGSSSIVAGTSSHDTGASWTADGSLIYVSDESGWFQVVRRSPDGKDRIALTDGDREHGEPSGGYGFAPLPSPDGRRQAVVRATGRHTRRRRPRPQGSTGRGLPERCLFRSVASPRLRPRRKCGAAADGARRGRPRPLRSSAASSRSRA